MHCVNAAIRLASGRFSAMKSVGVNWIKIVWRIDGSNIPTTRGSDIIQPNGLRVLFDVIICISFCCIYVRSTISNEISRKHSCLAFRTTANQNSNHGQRASHGWNITELNQFIRNGDGCKRNVAYQFLWINLIYVRIYLDCVWSESSMRAFVGWTFR